MTDFRTVLVLDRWNPGGRYTCTIRARWCISRSPRMHPLDRTRSRRCNRASGPSDSLPDTCTRNHPPCSRIPHPCHMVRPPRIRLYLLVMVSRSLYRATLRFYMLTLSLNINNKRQGSKRLTSTIESFPFSSSLSSQNFSHHIKLKIRFSTTKYFWFYIDPGIELVDPLGIFLETLSVEIRSNSNSPSLQILCTKKRWRYDTSSSWEKGRRNVSDN